MDVLIKGMKMPKNCTICRFCAPEADPGDGEMCMATGRFMPPCSTERLEECPLVELPTPHGRLIDADELYEKISLLFQDVNSTEDFMGIGYNHGVGDALAIIKNF